MPKVKWPKKDCYVVDVPLFGGKVYVFYSRETFDIALRSLNLAIEDQLEFFGGMATCVEHPDLGRAYLVGIFEHDSGIVCHECVHLTQYITSYAGADDDETDAYLTQYLFDKIVAKMPEVKDETSKEA